MLSTAIVPDALPTRMSDAQVRREFVDLVDNHAKLVCVGDARHHPRQVLRGNLPTSKLELFNTTFYLTGPRQNPDLRFFVAYVMPAPTARKPSVYARIFYKDNSLIWRVASHMFSGDGDFWIGKGDSRIVLERNWKREYSNESTTDLPLEMQSALEALNHQGKVRRARTIVQQIVRRASRNRIRAFDDFTKPRRQAEARPGGRINGGRRIARFTKPGDPTSLVIVHGYEPDFANGLVGYWRHRSRFYGGMIRRYRVLSVNRKIQHLFFLSPRHAWMIPPQTLTTELSSYGVRTIDVPVDDNAYLPGYEYHFVEDDDSGNPQLYSQIPEGYAGARHPNDESRVDASPWLDKIPLMAEFRRFAKSNPKPKQLMSPG